MAHQRQLRHRHSHPLLGLVAMVIVLVTGCSIGTDDDDTAGDGTQTTQTTEATGTTEAGDGGGEGGEPQGALLMIMDASGSMNADVGGRPKIETAKDALHDVIDVLPDGLHTGLRVFGHRYPSDDRTNGCRDTELIAPVAPLDRDALGSAIDGYEARGFSPIGLSLQEAGDDLTTDGPSTVVLVSDGEDTCGTPDPCQAARDLEAGGTDVVLHTVGVALGDNPTARDQLTCIADAGGGEFYDVDDIGDLSTTLEDVAERESRRFETAGEPLQGAPIPRDANTGTVGTSHTDEVIAEETNYYRFEIEPGSEVQAQVILAPNPAIAGDTVRSCSASVALTNGDTDQLGDFDTQYGSTTDAVEATTPPVQVDDDEVYVKIQADCSNFPEPDITYDIELELTTTG